MPIGLGTKIEGTTVLSGNKVPLIDGKFVELKGTANPEITNHSSLSTTDVFLIQREIPATGGNTYHTSLDTIAQFIWNNYEWDTVGIDWDAITGDWDDIFISALTSITADFDNYFNEFSAHEIISSITAGFSAEYFNSAYAHEIISSITAGFSAEYFNSAYAHEIISNLTGDWDTYFADEAADTIISNLTGGWDTYFAENAADTIISSLTSDWETIFGENAANTIISNLTGDWDTYFADEAADTIISNLTGNWETIFSENAANTIISNLTGDWETIFSESMADTIISNLTGDWETIFSDEVADTIISSISSSFSGDYFSADIADGMIANLTGSFSASYFSDTVADQMLASISSSFSADHFNELAAGTIISSISSSFSADHFNTSLANNIVDGISSDFENLFTTDVFNSITSDIVSNYDFSSLAEEDLISSIAANFSTDNLTETQLSELLSSISSSLSSDLRTLSSDFIVSSVSSSIQTNLYSSSSDFMVDAISSQIYETYKDAISGEVAREILSISSSISSEVVDSVSLNILDWSDSISADAVAAVSAQTWSDYGTYIWIDAAEDAARSAIAIYGPSICANVVNSVYDDVLQDYLPGITSSVSAEAYANIDPDKIGESVADDVYDLHWYIIRESAIGLVSASSWNQDRNTISSQASVNVSNQLIDDSSITSGITGSAANSIATGLNSAVSGSITGSATESLYGNLRDTVSGSITGSATNLLYAHLRDTVSGSITGSAAQSLYGGLSGTITGSISSEVTSSVINFFEATSLSSSISSDIVAGFDYTEFASEIAAQIGNEFTWDDISDQQESLLGAISSAVSADLYATSGLYISNAVSSQIYSNYADSISGEVSSNIYNALNTASVTSGITGSATAALYTGISEAASAAITSLATQSLYTRLSEAASSSITSSATQSLYAGLSGSNSVTGGITSSVYSGLYNSLNAPEISSAITGSAAQSLYAGLSGSTSAAITGYTATEFLSDFTENDDIIDAISGGVSGSLYTNMNTDPIRSSVSSAVSSNIYTDLALAYSSISGGVSAEIYSDLNGDLIDDAITGGVSAQIYSDLESFAGPITSAVSSQIYTDLSNIETNTEITSSVSSTIYNDLSSSTGSITSDVVSGIYSGLTGSSVTSGITASTVNSITSNSELINSITSFAGLSVGNQVYANYNNDIYTSVTSNVTNFFQFTHAVSAAISSSIVSGFTYDSEVIEQIIIAIGDQFNLDSLDPAEQDLLFSSVTSSLTGDMWTLSGTYIANTISDEVFNTYSDSMTSDVVDLVSASSWTAHQSPISAGAAETVALSVYNNNLNSITSEATKYFTVGADFGDGAISTSGDLIHSISSDVVLNFDDEPIITAVSATLSTTLNNPTNQSAITSSVSSEIYGDLSGNLIDNAITGGVSAQIYQNLSSNEIKDAISGDVYNDLYADVVTDNIKDTISSNVETQLLNDVVTDVVKDAISSDVYNDLYADVVTDNVKDTISGNVETQLSGSVVTDEVKSSISSSVSSSLWATVDTEYTSAITGAVTGELYDDLAFSDTITGGITADIVSGYPYDSLNQTNLINTIATEFDSTDLAPSEVSQLISGISSSVSAEIYTASGTYISNVAGIVAGQQAYAFNVSAITGNAAEIASTSAWNLRSNAITGTAAENAAISAWSLESSSIIDGAVGFLTNTTISSSLTSDTFETLTAAVVTDTVKHAISSNVEIELENQIVTNAVKDTISGAVSASLWNTVDTEYTSAITGAVSGEINSDINTPTVKSAISSAVSSSLWATVDTEYTSAITEAVTNDLYDDLALSDSVTGGITGDVVGDLYSWFALSAGASDYRTNIVDDTGEDLYGWFKGHEQAASYRNSITSDTSSDLFNWFIDIEGEDYRNSISSYAATDLSDWFKESTGNTYKNSISSYVYNDLISDTNYIQNISDAVSASVNTYMITNEINDIATNIESYFTTGGDGDLTDNIVAGASSHFTTGIVEDDLTNAITGATSGYFTSGLKLIEITGDIFESSTGFYTQTQALSSSLTAAVYNSSYTYYTTGDGGVGSDIISNATDYFTNGLPAYNITVTASRLVSDWFTLSGGQAEIYRTGISAIASNLISNWFTEHQVSEISSTVATNLEDNTAFYNSVAAGASGYFIEGGGGDLTDIITDAASGYFTTGDGESSLTNDITTNVSSYFESNNNLINTITDATSGYFITGGGGDLTDAITSNVSSYFESNNNLINNIVDATSGHFITGGVGDLSDDIISGASGYFTTGDGAGTLIDGATTNIESYFTTSPGNNLIVDPVTSNWNQDFTDLYDNWSNSLYSSSAQFAEELQFSKTNLIQFVNSENFHMSARPLAATAWNEAQLASSAGGFATFLDQMRTKDASFGNLNEIKRNNKLGALRAQLQGRGEENTWHLTPLPRLPYYGSDYSINIQDDRFISITADNFTELNGLDQGLIIDNWTNLTPAIEGGACLDSDPEVIEDSGVTLSASIWITIADSETLNIIKSRIYNLDELTKCSFVFYDAITGVPQHQWKSHKFSILDWDDTSGALKIKLGNIRKRILFQTESSYRYIWKYVWTYQSGYNFELPSGENVKYSIIIDESLPLVEWSDIFDFWNQIMRPGEEDAYSTVRNDSILNFKYLVHSWWLSPAAIPYGGGSLGSPIWQVNNDVIELPVLMMSFPANSEYVFEAKSLLPRIFVENADDSKRGLGLGIRAWSYSGDTNDIISTSSPLTANIGNLIFDYCYIPGRRYPTNNGIEVDEVGSNLSGGTCWNTMQVKVPDLNNTNNWNYNISSSAEKTNNIVLQFSVKTNFRWYGNDPYDQTQFGLNGIVYLKDFALYTSNPQGESFVDADNIKFYNDNLESPAYEKVFENGNLKTGLAKSDGTVSLDSDRVVDYLLGRRKIPSLQSAAFMTESALVNRNLRVLNSFEAKSKSFLIDDQQHNNLLLQHGSLEGPEHGVYIRDVIKSNSNSHLIEFPDYWSWLINPDSITVIITPMGRWQELWYEVTKKGIIVRNNKDQFIECSIQINAERIDVNKLQLRIEK